MDIKAIISIFFVAIVLYLLLKNASGTASVVKAIGGQISSITATLQGNNSMLMGGVDNVA